MAYHLAEEICSNCSIGMETEKDDGTVVYTCTRSRRQYEADEMVSFCPRKVSQFFMVASPSECCSNSEGVWFIDYTK